MKTEITVFLKLIMYKRKFPKTKNVEKDSSQLQRTNTDTLSVNTPTLSVTSNKNSLDDAESTESPSMLEDFSDFPIEKKRKTVDTNYVDDMTDGGSEPLFDDDDDTFSYLKQTLISCGLYLKCDQNILS